MRENGIGGNHESEGSDSKPTKKYGSRSRSASRTTSPVQDDAAGEILNDAGRADAAATGSDSEKSKKVKRARSPSDHRKSKIDAADDLTLEQLMQDLVKNGERVKPRDVDPGKQMPDPFVVRSVAATLMADPSSWPVVELGIPDTKRRSLARKRLHRVLGIKFMQAEKLLTASALTHPKGKESYVHALALGKCLKRGARVSSVEDGAESHRVYLRNQVGKSGYTSQQVNMALQDLEASLGLLNITAMDVQGWLVRQAVACNQAHQKAAAERRSSLGGQKPQQVPSGCQKAADLLRRCGMNDVATALHQAASNLPLGSKNCSAAVDHSRALQDMVSNVQKEGADEDPHWNKPPAVKLFLLARSSMHLQMQKVSTMPTAQLLQTFDIQLVTWPTLVEAVQHFPEACGVKYELSESFQRYIEDAKVSIHELELGSQWKWQS